MLPICALLLIMSVLLFPEEYGLSSTVVGPKVHLPENVYQFGRVVEGSEVAHDFTIRNQGDELLLIVDIESHCGCTAATPVERIAPEEEGVIRVNLKTARGLYAEIITVHTDSEVRPSFPIFVVGRVR